MEPFANDGTIFLTAREALLSLTIKEKKQFTAKGNSGSREKFKEFISNCGSTLAGKNKDWVTVFKTLLFSDLAPAFGLLRQHYWARDEFKISWGDAALGSRCFPVSLAFQKSRKSLLIILGGDCSYSGCHTKSTRCLWKVCRTHFAG